MKCPKCHEGDFIKGHPYNLKGMDEIYSHCSNCNEKYSKEPGFYYGAMYVSYGVGIAFAVAAFVISFLILGLDKTAAFIAIIGTLVVFLPVILRLSRNIWINFFFKYQVKESKS